MWVVTTKGENVERMVLRNRSAQNDARRTPPMDKERQDAQVQPLLCGGETVRFLIYEPHLDTIQARPRSTESLSLSL